MSRHFAMLVSFLFVTSTVLVSQPKILWTVTQPAPDSLFYMHDVVKDHSGNIFVISGGLTKYSNTGAKMWRKILPNLGSFVYKMTTDKQGNVYIIVNSDDDKQTLIKYSPSGDSLWARTLNLEKPSEDYRSQNRLIAADDDGNVYLAVQHEQRTSGGFFKTFLMVSSYSSAGQLRWLDTTVTAMPLNREPEFGDLMLGKMIVDQTNNIIIAITSRSEINPSLFIAATKIVKYTSNGGSPAWTHSLAISGVNVEFSDMDIDASGNIFVAYNHFLSFTEGGRIRKISSSGTAQWDRMTANSGAKVAADHNGGVYAGIGRSVGFTVTSRIFRFNGPDSTFIGIFGGGNYSMVHHLAVDPTGYVAVSGVMKQSFSAAEGSYLFTEFTPNGEQNGSVVYSSPGISYEYPHFLFKGNGTYSVVGQSIYPLSKSVLWFNKINVVPNPPAPPDPQPEKGWATQNSGTNTNLNSVWFKEGSEGWVVGDSGTVLRTTNAGHDWTKVALPAKSNFMEVKFFNDTLGFIIGEGGIFRTSDKGTTWIKVFDANEQTLYSITSNNAENFVAVGTNGLGKISTDWGATWNSIPAATTVTLRDVEFFQGALVSVGDGGNIFYTETFNGWFPLVSGNLLGQNFRAIKKTDSKLLLFGSVLGEINQSIKVTNSIEFPPTVLSGISENLNSDVAIVVGEMGIIGYLEEEKPARYKTISAHNLNDVFQSGSFVVVVGDNGTIINFNNRTRITTPKTNELVNTISMIDPQTFIYSTQNKLLRTSNGGISWNVIDSSGKWSDRFNVVGPMVWGSKHVDSIHTVMLSTDKGLTWQNRSPIAQLKHYPFVSTPNGKDVIFTSNGIEAYKSPVYYSNDFGLQWRVVDTVYEQSQHRFHFNDSTIIWREVYDYGKKSYSLQKHNSLSPLWETVFLDSVSNITSTYRFTLLKDGQLFLTTVTMPKLTYHSDNGGMTWKKYPSSINSPEHIEHRTFANLGGFNLEMSDDGNFSHKTGPDYFFTKSRGYFKQKYYGENKHLLWNEGEQIIFEQPLQIDTTRTMDRFLFLSSAGKKPISNTVVAADTIIVEPNISGYSVQSVTVYIDKIVHTAIGDLTIILSHNSVTDTLFHQLGFSADNMFNVVFSDVSTNDLAFVRAPFSGEYRPFSPLGKFIGTDPAGAWILKIYDKAPADSGMLEVWSLKLKSDQITSVNSNGLVPTEYSLMQNFPNPFNPTTMINYQLPMNSKVSLKIYDILGREVATLVNEVVNAGTYSTPFNSTRLASGVYFYRIEATAADGSRNRFVDVKKMMYLK